MFQNDIIEKFWRNLVTSPKLVYEQDKSFKKAVKTARIHGFAYRDIGDITQNAGEYQHMQPHKLP